mgnify:CR=1 FL=1
MRKILHGKLYDTDTARYIGSKQSIYYKSDYRYFEEGLYKKKTGEFFLYGEGGPASRYAEYLESGGCIGGKQIIPLSENEAKEWAEKNLTVGEYEELFGICEE